MSAQHRLRLDAVAAAVAKAAAPAGHIRSATTGPGTRSGAVGTAVPGPADPRAGTGTPAAGANPSGSNTSALRTASGSVHDSSVPPSGKVSSGFRGAGDGGHTRPAPSASNRTTRG